MLCNRNDARLSLSHKTRIGHVMEYAGGEIKPDCLKQPVGIPDIRAYYQLLQENIGDTFFLSKFELFYVDLCRRIKMGTALLQGVLIADHLVSCGCAVSIDHTSAVIGGVATLSAFRHKGYGSACVLALTKKLYHRENVKKIFLHRESDKLQHFYHQLGYRDVSQWQEIDFSKPERNHI